VINKKKKDIFFFERHKLSSEQQAFALNQLKCRYQE
jgi:hypothetical protein